MSALCKQVDAFADGELRAEEVSRFEEHLVDCARCARELEFIFALRGVVETSPVVHRPNVTEQIQIPRRRWSWAWASADGFGMLAVAAAAVLLVFPQRIEPWVSGATRPIEPRLSDPRADVFRPYDELRGGRPDGLVSYDGLGDLQRKNDVKGLVSRLLLQRQVNEATRLLAGAAALDNERAVAALLEGKPEEAVGHIERMGTAPGKQAQWNRALALREMGLAYAAAAAFRAVEARGEPGWSGEAGVWARKLQAQVVERRRSFEEARAATERLVRAHQVPATAVVEGWPDLVRGAFYDAIRTAPSREVVARLAPLALALDAHFGGRSLADYVAQVERLDFTRRAPLAARYEDLRAKGGEPAVEYARALRGAGKPGRDLLAGMLLGGARRAAAPGELAGLVGGDPWLESQALDVAAQLETDLAVGGARETLLRRGIELASRHRLELERLELERRLSVLLLRQQRPIDAEPLLRRMRTSAQSLRLWSSEVQALVQLAHLSIYEEDFPAAKAYAEEVALAAEPCTYRSVDERLAEQAVNEGDLPEARRALERVERCAKDRSWELPGLQALSELARRDPGEATRFRRELLRYRERPPAGVLTPADALAALALEGRAVIDGNRAEGRRLLERVVADADALRADSREMDLPRLLAYRRLISDAAGDPARALSLIGAEADLDLPEGGCVVGVSEDLRKGTVVARVGGKYLVRSGQPALAAAPKSVVPAEIKAALSGCPEVAVVALSPFRGKPSLLPAEVAWSHHTGRAQEPARLMVERRLVISDATPPRAFALPTLPAWQPSPGGKIWRHLRGPEANPQAVLRELENADLVEFHVHAMANFKVSEAPYLVLSEDARGQARLEADAVRGLVLRRRPFVVLAACESARNSPYWPSYSARLSLPSAFLDAGARAVLAANREIPDRDASAFVAQVIEKVVAGVPGPVALRDVRISWLRDSAASWVEDIVLFQ